MRNQFAFEAEPFAGYAEMDEFEGFDTGLADEWMGEVSRSSRDYIRWVQQSLNKFLGLRLAVDGIMGPTTRSAIRSFQQRQGLTPDGIVGPQTEQQLRLLVRGSTPTAPSTACPPRPVFVDCPPPGTPFEVLDNFTFDGFRLNRSLHTPRIIKIARQIIASQRSPNPIRSLLIAGHTDPVGDENYNFLLSRRRAEEVMRELCTTLERMSPGLARHIKFQLTPCGERQTKATPEQSRRVEVFFPGAGRVVPACPVPPALNRDFIVWLQRSLNQVLGLRLPTNGVVGVQTRSALRSFQQRRGLVSSGTVDRTTQKALAEMGRLLPVPCEIRDTDEPTPTPKGLVLLSHPHVRRTCRDGRTFSSDASPTPMSPATMNPGFLKADGFEFDTRLDAKLVDLLVDTPKYAAMLAPESKKKRAPSKGDKIRVALVDLTGDKICKPGFAGWGSTTRVPGGSTAKIAIVYTAHQLLFDLNELARAGSIGTAADLKTKAIDTWSGLACKPDLNWLVKVDESATPVKARASANLKETLKKMVDATFSNVSTRHASELILRLGFEYIASVLWQSGLRHPTRGGLWIGNTFTAPPFAAKTNAACHSGKNPTVWAKNPLGTTGIALTALSAATFFALLAQQRLVNGSASLAMENLLKDGCILSSIPGVTIRATKCGLVDEPNFKVGHDAVLIESGTRRYVAVCLTTDPAWSARSDFMKDLDRLIKDNNTP